MSPLIAALLGSAPGIAKSIFGASQGLRARDLAKMDRPTREVPAAIQEMVANAKMMAGMTQLPGQQRIEEKIGSSGATALSQAQQASPSSAATLGSLSDIYGKQMGQYADLEGMAANFWAGNQEQLQGALGTQAGWQDQAWQWNEAQPYMQQMDAARRLNEASAQNIFGGLAGAIGGGLAGYGGQELSNSFGGILEEFKNYWKNLPGGEGQDTMGMGYERGAPPSKSLWDLMQMGATLTGNDFSSSPRKPYE